MKKKDRAYFITLEGIEGVGKSTALQFIDQWLSERNHPHRLTREPGGTPIAEAIRQVILSQHNTAMDAKAELLLFFASRVQHVAELIQPSLAQGYTVVCDRFIDASYIYQGVGRGIPKSLIASLEAFIEADIRPDLTLLLDAPQPVCVERLQARAEGKDRIELEKAAFFERIREAYLERAKRYADRFRVIDASVPLHQVQAQIAQVLQALVT